jgi:hypothetical protein
MSTACPVLLGAQDSVLRHTLDDPWQRQPGCDDVGCLAEEPLGQEARPQPSHH